MNSRSFITNRTSRVWRWMRLEFDSTDLYLSKCIDMLLLFSAFLSSLARSDQASAWRAFELPISLYSSATSCAFSALVYACTRSSHLASWSLALLNFSWSCGRTLFQLLRFDFSFPRLTYPPAIDPPLGDRFSRMSMLSRDSMERPMESCIEDWIRPMLKYQVGVMSDLIRCTSIKGSSHLARSMDRVAVLNFIVWDWMKRMLEEEMHCLKSGLLYVRLRHNVLDFRQCIIFYLLPKMKRNRAEPIAMRDWTRTWVESSWKALRHFAIRRQVGCAFAPFSVSLLSIFACFTSTELTKADYTLCKGAFLCWDDRMPLDVVMSSLCLAMAS